MSDTPEAASKPDRTDAGQFAVGNRGGPGNPFAREVAELRRAILGRLTVESVEAIADTLITRAQGGDVAAARLLFQYALGKPAKAIEPDRVEIDDHNLRKESTVPLSEMVQPFGYISVEKMNDLSETLRPIVDQNMLKPFAVGLDALKGVDVPTKQQKKDAERAARRAMRRLYRGMSPSPNGSDGDAGGVSIVGEGTTPRRPGGPHRAG